MKKFYLILAALVLTLSLSGCSKPKTEDEMFLEELEELQKEIEKELKQE